MNFYNPMSPYDSTDSQAYTTTTVDMWKTFAVMATEDPKKVAQKVLDKVWEFATKDAEVVELKDGTTKLMLDYNRLEGAIKKIKEVIND